MDVTELIRHPEQMDRETLYELRSMLALYPYFQTARLLLLQNLFLLHDPTFDEELRRAAIYITDRRVLFQMIEAGHYQLKTAKQGNESRQPSQTTKEPDSRTISLIDNFLESLPKDEEQTSEKKTRRKPTPADAAVDYVAYLLESGYESDDEQTQEETPQLKGQSLIDTFINQDKGKIILNDTPTQRPELENEDTETEDNNNEGLYTETMARIYIKQGRFERALEIIQQISLHSPKKNAYFADQIRFLEKLIINNNKK